MRNGAKQWWVAGGVFLGVVAFWPVRIAWADDVYTFVIKKQAEKEKRQWSLSDWLDTRDRMRMMDLWLALHSPTPYEYFLGASYQFVNGPTGSISAQDVSLAAFVTIFGLELQYESTFTQRTLALFDFRIFGYHDQGTNITLSAGLRNENQSGNSFRNPVAGVRMTLYLTRYFGVEGIYRYFFSSTPTVSGVTYSGDRIEGGAFLDFKALRLFGDYFVESGTLPFLNGAKVGFKLYL